MQKEWDNILSSNCDWCPLKCGADRKAGQVGLCGADDTLVVSRHSLHYWEEPVISGTVGGPKRGQGPGSGTIFFANCSLKCCYCQNYKISGVGERKVSGDEELQEVSDVETTGGTAEFTDDSALRAIVGSRDGSNVGSPTTLSQLVDMMLELQNHGAMNINIVTGSHYRSQIISAIRKAKNLGLNIPVVWNTSGYETAASIGALSSVVDIWLTDFKYANNALAKAMSHNKIAYYVDVATEALESMLDYTLEHKFDNFNDNLRMTKGIIVRHMLIPGQLQNSKDVLKLLFDNFENDVKYSIMNQYTPVISEQSPFVKQFPELLQAPTQDEYDQLLDYADELGIKDYYWQVGGANSESFIPDFR